MCGNLLDLSLDKSYLPLQASQLTACWLYGDLICFVHTVNKLQFLNHHVVIEDCMLFYYMFY